MNRELDCSRKSSPRPHKTPNPICYKVTYQVPGHHLIPISLLFVNVCHKAWCSDIASTKAMTGEEERTSILSTCSMGCKNRVWGLEGIRGFISYNISYNNSPIHKFPKVCTVFVSIRHSWMVISIFQASRNRAFLAF